MILAFDADVLIFAAERGNALGGPVRRVLKDPASVLYGSTLLLPEMLSKPIGAKQKDDVEALTAALASLNLVEVSESVAQLAVQLGARHNLRAADAVHLATASWVGADAFVTNNLKDFKPDEIEEVTVLTPADL